MASNPWKGFKMQMCSFHDHGVSYPTVPQDKIKSCIKTFFELATRYWNKPFLDGHMSSYTGRKPTSSPVHWHSCHTPVTRFTACVWLVACRLPHRFCSVLLMLVLILCLLVMVCQVSCNSTMCLNKQKKKTLNINGHVSAQ